ncbi:MULTISPECIES: helix-turn-helix domain-containing protein [Enterobacterales]|uniref:helix-turn-helix domain-containing protein n=1 Tax=Enterobacterales TaxID=91347 RepID=UPI000F7F32C3|nr:MULTISPECIES: helix-turn-helix domain-containing protein [Enterobacterales]RSV87613.1 helix-turn-helix domain-containing protein [Klebsiella aerogenes]
MNLSKKVIEVLIIWIDENLDKPLKIEHVAQYSGYSQWHLQRIFLDYKGVSLARYIRTRKLQMAAKDLRETEEAIMTISLKYGFESQQTFTRLFRSYYHKPPGAYRKHYG